MDSGGTAGTTSINRLYREFSRQKFNSYKLKYPRLKEAEITRKVLKEWEDLDGHSRLLLQEDYRRKNFLSDAPLNNRETKQAPLKVTSLEKVPAKQVAKVTHKFVLPRPDESSGDPPEANSSGRFDSESSSNHRTKRIRKLKRAINELPNAEYLMFFKFYYGRLTKEHPRWSTHQRTTIIKLLWKKRQIQKKRELQVSRLKVPVEKVPKPVRHSGYTLFASNKLQKNSELTEKEVRNAARATWNKLNRAGKLIYEKKARLHNASLDPSVETSKQRKGVLELLRLTI